MLRFINFLLIVLVIISFFFGVRVGKTIQKIDTPVQTEYTTKKIIPTVSLVLNTLASCKFSFLTPSSTNVTIASSGATIQLKKQKLNLSCIPEPTKTNEVAKYKNSITNKTLYITGSSSLYQQLKAGFEINSSYKLSTEQSD